MQLATSGWAAAGRWGGGTGRAGTPHSRTDLEGSGGRSLRGGGGGGGGREKRGRPESPRRRRRRWSGVRVSPARRGHRALPRGRDAGPWDVGIEALRMVDSAEKRSVIVFPEQPKALEVEYAGPSPLWPLLLRSLRTGSAAMAHGPSRSAACGILPDRVPCISRRTLNHCTTSFCSQVAGVSYPWTVDRLLDWCPVDRGPAPGLVSTEVSQVLSLVFCSSMLLVYSWCISWMVMFLHLFRTWWYASADSGPPSISSALQISLNLQPHSLFSVLISTSAVGLLCPPYGRTTIS
ncbi:uncharacterized protein [Physeter macrocephalus]|uniref:Uncharacterized protein isoform X2 n=1 Tax=Physeter macrocephalus TaxID=9755 RepID=A0A9W2WNG0_PHYMC|nr:uncharacterized protein LOC129392087 isoform X2 [Physeter catodon]